MPMELGVDVLACVTRHWMRDDGWLNIYGWWPADHNPPIVIFSIAGFDELAPEGPETNRAIANNMVTTLAGFYGNVGTHARSKNCPLWFDKARKFETLVSQQKFDAVCRRKLKRQMGNKFNALEELLKVFS
jgi:hypothetical protein